MDRNPRFVEDPNKHNTPAFDRSIGAATEDCAKERNKLFALAEAREKQAWKEYLECMEAHKDNLMARYSDCLSFTDKANEAMAFLRSIDTMPCYKVRYWSEVFHIENIDLTVTNVVDLFLARMKTEFEYLMNWIRSDFTDPASIALELPEIIAKMNQDLEAQYTRIGQIAGTGAYPAAITAAKKQISANLQALREEPEPQEINPDDERQMLMPFILNLIDNYQSNLLKRLEDISQTGGLSTQQGGQSSPQAESSQLPSKREDRQTTQQAGTPERATPPAQPLPTPPTHSADSKYAQAPAAKTCPRCGMTNQADFRFCFKCGSALPSSASSMAAGGGQKQNAPTPSAIWCPDCGHRSQPGNNFCVNCGSNLRARLAGQPSIPTGKPAPQPTHLPARQPNDASPPSAQRSSNAVASIVQPTRAPARNEYQSVHIPSSEANQQQTKSIPANDFKKSTGCWGVGLGIVNVLGGIGVIILSSIVFYRDLNLLSILLFWGGLFEIILGIISIIKKKLVGRLLVILLWAFLFLLLLINLIRFAGGIFPY